MDIDWTKQHCGLIRSSYEDFLLYMPDLKSILETFPEDPRDFTWDVKVHMLMPGQFPCIPNWHYDNIPRVNGNQDFSLVKPNLPMYLWLSSAPLTEFENGFIEPMKWFKFTQNDLHRGTASEEFTWRCFIRATHKDILELISAPIRRHSQVYLDSNNFTW